MRLLSVYGVLFLVFIYAPILMIVVYLVQRQPDQHDDLAGLHPRLVPARSSA